MVGGVRNWNGVRRWWVTGGPAAAVTPAPPVTFVRRPPCRRARKASAVKAYRPLLARYTGAARKRRCRARAVQRLCRRIAYVRFTLTIYESVARVKVRHGGSGATSAGSSGMPRTQRTKGMEVRDGGERQ